MERRWDGDERGGGVADARTYAPGAAELVEAMHEQGWVAEDPDAHLLPHLERACRSLPLELVRAETRGDGTFVVELTWLGDTAGAAAVRSAVYALAGSIAETASYVRQRRDGSRLVFELVTGEIGDDLRFAPHGHSVSFEVRT